MHYSVCQISIMTVESINLNLLTGRSNGTMNYISIRYTSFKETLFSYIWLCCFRAHLPAFPCNDTEESKGEAAKASEIERPV